MEGAMRGSRDEEALLVNRHGNGRIFIPKFCRSKEGKGVCRFAGSQAKLFICKLEHQKHFTTCNLDW